MSATILIGAGISASAFSHHFNGDVEIYEKASRVGGRLCARNYKEFIIQFGAQYATSSNSVFDDYLIKTGAIDYLPKPAEIDQIYDALTNSKEILPPPPENPMTADRIRWEHIQRVFIQCNRNVSETARRLRMHRRTLQRILNKHAPRE